MTSSKCNRILANLMIVFVLAVLLASVGCATRGNIAQNSRPFSFEQDTLCYANDLSWEYFYDASGKWCSKPRQPKPDYTQHCFVVSRSARQFFLHARFDSTLPRLEKVENEKLARKVLARSLSKPSDDNDRVVIPGYVNLHDFSCDYESILKKEAGGAWHSYFQRGHWRMMLPFRETGQEKTARQLKERIENHSAPIIHLVRFPQLTINHAALLYAAKETPEAITFSMYDPNYPKKPATLTFDRKTRHFNLPANTYYMGGRVNVYEIYKSFFL